MASTEKKLPSCTLMIATYNWPEALYLCLMSALNQTHPPNEIIIADDGSTAETKQLIDRITKQTNIPIVHIWHPDKGFQLTTIRNKAIRSARYDYLIQIDGDVLLNKNFVYDHLKLASEGSFLCGSRVLLSSETSNKLLKMKNFNPGVDDIPLQLIFNSLRIPFLTGLFADRYKKNKLYVLRGCNMSFWRSDLLQINGYNEDITGWGSEDFELAMRLINTGVKKRFLKFGGIEYHIYHNENSRDKQQRNIDILQKTIQNKITWIDNGIIKANSN